MQYDSKLIQIILFKHSLIKNINQVELHKFILWSAQRISLKIIIYFISTYKLPRYRLLDLQNSVTIRRFAPHETKLL